MPPDPPKLWRALHTIPHPLGKFGQTGFFLLPKALFLHTVCDQKLEAGTRLHYIHFRPLAHTTSHFYDSVELHVLCTQRSNKS